MKSELCILLMLYFHYRLLMGDKCFFFASCFIASGLLIAGLVCVISTEWSLTWSTLAFRGIRLALSRLPSQSKVWRICSRQSALDTGQRIAGNGQRILCSSAEH